MRVVIGDVLEYRGFAEGEGNADDEQQCGEQHRVQADVEVQRAIEGLHLQLGLRVGQQEQADPADPQHPPGHALRAPAVRHPAADRAQHAARQREAGGQQRCALQAEAIFLDVVLGHPQRQGHVAAEDDRVVLAVAPHRRFGQGLELFAQARAAGTAMGLVFGAEKPEQHGGDEQDGAEHFRYQLPAAGGNQRRGEELGHRRPGVAGAEDAHGQALVVLFEPLGNVGNAHRERAAGKADEQAQHQELPVSRGVADQVQRQHAGQHQQEEHAAPAEAVGEHAQRQAHQRAGQHRGGGQQAELGFVELEQFLDRYAEHGKHHPDHETDGESQRAHAQYQALSYTRWGHVGSPVSSLWPQTREANPEKT
ncbi:hypothetical protein D9M71_383150 [compost metagenome]